MLAFIIISDIMKTMNYENYKLGNKMSNYISAEKRYYRGITF